MKKSLFFFVAVTGIMLVAQPSQAQNKIGYISLQELIPMMPEFKKAETELSDYQKALVQMGAEHQAEFYRKDSIFKADSTGWNSAVKEIKRKELNELYLKWVNFNQQAQQMSQQREQDLLAPIQQKAIETTQAVAKENGYLYILTKEQLIAFPTSEDVLPLVAKKLNIKLDKPATNPPPATPNTPKKNN